MQLAQCPGTFSVTRVIGYFGEPSRTMDIRCAPHKREQESGLPPRATPKNYLMAWLLVMLKEGDLHGYEIMKALKERFDVVADPGTVYRSLRKLEQDGNISSWWNPAEQGPARRVYALTDRGHEVLALWSAALGTYRTSLDAFFKLYESDTARP